MEHHEHSGAEGHDHAGGDLTRTAISATLHCLTGCAIGEVLGMALATAWGWGDAASIGLAVALAFVFGYALASIPLLRAGLPVRRVIALALAADTVSILTMEIIDNGIMLTIPGAMDTGLGDVGFWAALAAALFIAFWITVPVNRWLISRGKGHAVVHAYH
ncbi:unannotated protein [freshwater metagenome]|jgi:hypothetical protein|uniref:Unannotated protein n=1 Tax=freshwater metagenome TaxID=449393 RepID=A0A6J7GMM4_9ZZZZ|nr:DUF4396 domain-containing protein [Actinomycetota bacterium]